MKFSDILRTIGLMNKVPKNGQSINAVADGIDRLYQAYQPYQQMQNPYAYPSGAGASAPVGNVYPHQPPYQTHGPRGHGYKLGPGGGGGSGGGYGPSAPAGVDHSGYEQPGYGHPPQHSFSSGGGQDYGHPRPRSKSKASAAVTALTLLSFLFFINLLQNCLKEHMETMNPTVMVMTAGAGRNRGNKYKEVYRPSSKEVSSGDYDSDGKLEFREQETPLDGNDGKDSRTDSKNREKFTYSSGKKGTSTKDNYEQSSYHSDEEKRAEEKIPTKLRNDYFRDGSSHYVRIN